MTISVLFIILFCLIMLSGVLGCLGWWLASISWGDREKSSPFECGFDPKENLRMTFSLKFFLVGVIFLIFDVEIVLLLLLPLIQDFMWSWSFYCLIFFFVAVLIFGLFYEWKDGALDWSV